MISLLDPKLTNSIDAKEIHCKLLLHTGEDLIKSCPCKQAASLRKIRMGIVVNSNGAPHSWQPSSIQLK